jgi:hypothetical protein
MSWTKRTWTLAILLTAVVASPALAQEASLLTERWTPERIEARDYSTALVVGIARDDQARKNFENKMVSHLRGRDIESVSSYSIVDDLHRPGETSTILDDLLAKRVDAIITVRLIPAKEVIENAFVDVWNEGADSELRLRAYIQSALEGPAPKAKEFYVEIGLWEMVVSRSRVWAARTDAHKIKKLRKFSGEIIQDTIDGLELDRIF